MPNSIKNLNKLVNADNVEKTEMLIFKFEQMKFEGDLKINLCGKRIYPIESVKYLGVKINTNLSWQCQVTDRFIKLNRTNALFFEIRKYVSPKISEAVTQRCSIKKVF